MELNLGTKQSVIVRPYQDQDFKRIQQLNQEEGWSNLVAKSDDTKEAWANSNVRFVVEVETNVIGYIRGLTDTRITLYVCELLVDKKYRGLGIGKELLKYIHQKYPITRIELLASSTSSTFYEEQSFRKYYGFRKTVEEL